MPPEVFRCLDAGKIVAIFPRQPVFPRKRILEHCPVSGWPILPSKQVRDRALLIDGDFKLWRNYRIVFVPSFKLDASPANDTIMPTHDFHVEIMLKIIKESFDIT